MIRPVVVEMGKACTFPDCDCDSPYRAAGACVKPAQAAERAADLTRAWDDLPAALKAHPGIKALHRAAVAALPAAPAPVARIDARRLTPFDAVARAMDMASLLAGSVAMNDTHKADAYAQRLRTHLIEYIYPQDTAPAAAAVPVPLTDERIDAEWRAAVRQCDLTRDFVRTFARAIEAAHGIAQQPGGAG